MTRPEIRIKRVYEPADPEDGIRILVDRLWPRGISKERGRISHWARGVSPSNELRRWYGPDPEKWEEFRRRYFTELDSVPDAVAELREHRGADVVTFVYSSKEERLNNAHALKGYLES